MIKSGSAARGRQGAPRHVPPQVRQGALVRRAPPPRSSEEPPPQGARRGQGRDRAGLQAQVDEMFRTLIARSLLRVNEEERFVPPTAGRREVDSSRPWRPARSRSIFVSRSPARLRSSSAGCGDLPSRLTRSRVRAVGEGGGDLYASIDLLATEDAAHEQGVYVPRGGGARWTPR